MSVGTQLLLKTVQVSHVNIHQCLSLKYLSSLKSWFVKGKKKKLRIICSLIPWYTLPASISSGDIANRHNVDQGKREKRTENGVWQSYLLFPLSRSLHHYLYLWSCTWHFSIACVSQASFRKCTCFNSIVWKCKTFKISGVESLSAILLLFLINQYFPQLLLPWLGMQYACKLVWRNTVL